MKLFNCQSCGQMLYFENRVCERCGHRLGYLPDDDKMHAVEAAGDVWHALGAPEKLYKFCANAALDACNWLLPAGSEETLCAACRHNRTIPDVSCPTALAQWRKIELAKHRLFYTLIKLGLPLANRTDDPEGGLAFDFLEDPPQGASEGAVMTGHDNGLITLALKEADDAERETRRTQLHEPYRTLLGHFRHEIGHYYWDRLVRDENRLEACRALFGDDRQDYGAALQRHYDQGAPADWQQTYISAYAASHPWEDFAETWAHYLHIVDTLETAHAFGMRVRPATDRTGDLSAHVDFNPYRHGTIADMVEAWLPIAFAVNTINRSMGLADVYPFILTPAVIAKLGFIHDLVGADRTAKAAA
ncbi:putative zinc-binding peptidase [Nitrospirillum sp. BR 11163]|uniref:zinc-binding metallopeptidase family protein n=1 Tax=Nitrospirillum sp. BR 11163 TaxID=3104323 RepID=UPI002AFF7CD5|nr:putative zinc-binding peptidase [Nitrospirillum sp. BR 11163]MEA1673261.1 putative zinc-binding peptidase [Nitrospirillum sp. BR 11163]